MEKDYLNTRNLEAVARCYIVYHSYTASSCPSLQTALGDIRHLRTESQHRVVPKYRIVGVKWVLSQFSKVKMSRFVMVIRKNTANIMGSSKECRERNGSTHYEISCAKSFFTCTVPASTRSN